MTLTKDTDIPQSQPPNRDKLKSTWWRLNNLYWIEDKQGEVVKFKPNIFQTALFKGLHFRNIILKARQLGMSTFIAIFFLDQVLFHSNKKAAIVADKIENAGNIFAKISFAWDHFNKPLKKHLGLNITSDSKAVLSFSNGSSVRVGTTLHSGTYQYLHISEYGPLCNKFPEKAEDVKKAAFPTVPQGGIIFVESTAEGEGNDYHSMVMDAMETKERIRIRKQKELRSMEYKFFFFPWWENDEYQIQTTEDEVNSTIPRHLQKYFKQTEDFLKKQLGNPDFAFTCHQKMWYYLTKKELKERMLEQHPSYEEEAFLASGNKLFNAEILKKKLTLEVREPYSIEGDFTIYAPFKPTHSYGIGADVSRGVGRDSSAAVVIDFTENEVVATYHNNQISPELFAYDLAKLGRIFGNCVVAPENNDAGHTTCVILNKIYSNVYQFEIQGYVEDKATTRLGWVTNGHTKPKMMHELSGQFEDEDTPLSVPEPAILREAMMFKKDDTIPISIQKEAKLTRHFDLLIATAIANQMRSVAGVSMNKKIAEAIQRKRERVSSGANRFL